MPQRPPRKWFYACVESVSEDPAVTDPKAVCAWNWYYHMTPTRRRQILKGELFDPEDLAEGSNIFIFDPKRRRPSIYRIKMKWGDFLKVVNKFKKIGYHQVKVKGIIKSKQTPLTVSWFNYDNYRKAIWVMQQARILK